MINLLKTWYSSLVKKPSEPEEQEEDNSVAYCFLGVDKEDNLYIDINFIDGHEDAIAKLVYILCSGKMMELTGGLISERCADNIEQRDFILTEAFNMIKRDFPGIDDDEEDPVVDPCNVFRPNQGEEIEDEE
jgi:hypothetical protein